MFCTVTAYDCIDFHPVIYPAKSDMKFYPGCCLRVSDPMISDLCILPNDESSAEFSRTYLGYMQAGQANIEKQKNEVCSTYLQYAFYVREHDQIIICIWSSVQFMCRYTFVL